MILVAYDGALRREELVRLRALLGEDLLASRPYRLNCEVKSDWAAVAAQLAQQEPGAAAVASYLPAHRASSVNPVEALRME